MKNVVLVLLLLNSLSCQLNTQNGTPSVGTTEVNGYQVDSSIIVDGYKLKSIKLSECGEIKESLKEDYEFLNSNIGYFSIDTIQNKELNNRDFYRKILIETKFIEYMPNKLSKENSTFNLKRQQIKGYGDCYIGKFHFPRAPNAAQLRSTVIVNIAKKEITIWNFDDLKISKTGINCDFRVKGNHTIYKMVYSEKCKMFVPET